MCSDMNIPPALFFGISALLLVAGLAQPGAALARDKAKAVADSDLPGVVPPKPRVAPLPEGEPQSDPANNGWVRMGDWDVKISGSVRLDIRAGDTGRSQPR
jgi:hypothetical protein